MFKRNLVTVWTAILILSCMFLFGQESWVPSTGPTITSIDPPAAMSGEEITIIGSGFGASQGASLVTFSGVHAGTAISWSDTHIAIAVPSAISSGPVVVTVNTSRSNSFPFTAIEARQQIGVEGGTLQILDPQSQIYGVSLSIPEGALEEEKEISIAQPAIIPDLSQSLGDDYTIIGPIVQLRPNGTILSKSVTLRLPKPNPTEADFLFIYLYTENTEDLIPLTLEADTEDPEHFFLVSLDHFSLVLYLQLSFEHSYSEGSFTIHYNTCDHSDDNPKACIINLTEPTTGENGQQIPAYVKALADGLNSSLTKYVDDWSFRNPTPPLNNQVTISRTSGSTYERFSKVIQFSNEYTDETTLRIAGAHELCHAVMFENPLILLIPPEKWATEGTATLLSDAAFRDRYNNQNPPTFTLSNYVNTGAGMFSFNAPPLKSIATTKDDNDAYTRSSAFWLYITEQLGGYDPVNHFFILASPILDGTNLLDLVLTSYYDTTFATQFKNFADACVLKDFFSDNSSIYDFKYDNLGFLKRMDLTCRDHNSFCWKPDIIDGVQLPAHFSSQDEKWTISYHAIQVLGNPLLGENELIKARFHGSSDGEYYVSLIYVKDDQLLEPSAPRYFHPLDSNNQSSQDIIASRCISDYIIVVVATLSAGGEYWIEAHTEVGPAEGPYHDISCIDGIDNDCDGLSDAADSGCWQCTSSLDCDDEDPCTNDSCIDTACVYNYSSNSCDDGDICTMNDSCSAGICSGIPLDADRDSFVSDACGGNDCDDHNVDVHPGLTELCDDVDNDCDGQTDEGCSAIQGLRAHYPLDGDAKDSSGNGLDGIVHGTSWISTGACGFAIAFPGYTVTDYVELPSEVLDGLGDFTISLWFYSFDVTPGNRALLSGAGSFDDNELLMETHWGQISFIYRGTLEPLGPTALSNTTWYHYVLKREGSNIEMYLNGTEEDSGNYTSASLDVDALIIGQDQDVIGGGFEDYQAWEGAIDELQVYDRALSESEILDLYNQCSP